MLLSAEVHMPTAVPLLKPSSSSDGSISVFCWVQVRWGDALEILPDLKLPEGSTAIDLLLLDGVPKETLAYLRAAEPLLAAVSYTHLTLPTILLV